LPGAIEVIEDAEFHFSLRHCERSEAIQHGGAELDCFVASLLAMTGLSVIREAAR